MTDQKILVPYNFTPNDRKAVDQVVKTFAGRKDVEITLLNLYTAPPAFEPRGTPAMERMKQNLNYLSQRIREHEEELQRVRAEMVAGGLQEKQVQVRFVSRRRDVSTEIIEAAAQGGFRTVVLNREPRRMTRFFTPSVFTRVVQALKDTTVWIVN